MEVDHFANKLIPSDILDINKGDDNWRNKTFVAYKVIGNGACHNNAFRKLLDSKYTTFR